MNFVDTTEAAAVEMLTRIAAAVPPSVAAQMMVERVLFAAAEMVVTAGAFFGTNPDGSAWRLVEIRPGTNELTTWRGRREVSRVVDIEKGRL